ncbi:hypothetical protein DC31_02400 [Microbacterium sp. CH12i]|uniref:hypothetical protein n=1 Tax=Microbacterium sp. CH12i TaxID=1479651 RepID=UPI000461B78C|nr:hypothetical protein [Microbacterium sp. CH12i]KDA04928.1 hypothetical protein DC31_02400 [Microbacterium sp. CH12i]
MSEVTTEPKGKANASLLIRGAIWIAIGALIAAALVCVIWVLIGDQDGIIGRAFLTILLLAGFAGIAILEAGLATKRPDWLALASMITWIVALIVGAIQIWLPFEPGEFAGGLGRFFQLLLVIGILQLALLHVRLFTSSARRHVTTFTTVIYYVTIAILIILVAMLVFFLTLPDTFEYGDVYWRIVVALAILAAVGTMLIPLLNALFAPKKPAAPAASVQYAQQGYTQQGQGYAQQNQAYAAPGYSSQPAVAAPVAQQWPTYADGVTPLPMLQDGQPDWNAYYTGYPTQQQGYQQAPAPAQTFPVAQDYGQAPQAPDYSQAPQVPDYSQAPDAQPAPPASTVPPASAMPPVPPMPDYPQSTPTPLAAPEQTAPTPGSVPPPPPAPPR